MNVVLHHSPAKNGFFCSEKEICEIEFGKKKIFMGNFEWEDHCSC
jgi:hypothetical protein